MCGVFRDRLGGTREQQDRAIEVMQDSDRYTLDTHEGISGPLTERLRKAAIIQGRKGTGDPNRLVYISRRRD